MFLFSTLAETCAMSSSLNTLSPRQLIYSIDLKTGLLAEKEFIK